MRNRIALVAGLLLALGAFAPNAFAGTARTQTNIDVFVDCVTQGSGSYDATFGYTNDNSTAQTVRSESDNYFTPPSYQRRPDDHLPAGHRPQRLHGQGDPERDEAHLDRVAERAHRVGERELVVLARVRADRAGDPRLRRLRDQERRPPTTRPSPTRTTTRPHRPSRSEPTTSSRRRRSTAARPPIFQPGIAPRRVHGEGDSERDEARLDRPLRGRTDGTAAPPATSCTPTRRR